MNARQKAKYYKKQYEKMKSIASPKIDSNPFTHSTKQIIDLRVEQLVDMREMYELSASEECAFSAINKLLTSQFIHQILNYALIETIPNPYGYFDKTLIRATMKVVDLRRDKI